MRLQKSPKVAVIMAARNQEKYICKALNSILNQSYRSFEIIVVDDNSTDSTFAIGKSLTDPRVKVLKMREEATNGKLGAVRNYAIMNSKAPCIAICDADDIRYPKSFEFEVNYLDQHPEVAIVGTQYDEIDPYGNIIENPSAKNLYQFTGFKISDSEYRNERDWRRSLGGASSSVLREIYLKRRGPYSCPLAPTTTMFRREAFTLVGGYDPEVPFFVDVGLHRAFAVYFEMALLKEILAGWRQHPNRMSIRQWKQGGEPTTHQK